MIRCISLTALVLAMLAEGTPANAQGRITAVRGSAPAPSRQPQQVSPEIVLDAPPDSHTEPPRFTSKLRHAPSARQPCSSHPCHGGLGRRFIGVVLLGVRDGVVYLQPDAVAAPGVPLISGDAPTGGLQLDVEPRAAQVYVDGAYVGVVDDFRGYFQHLILIAGPHNLALVAPHYEPSVVPVVVSPGRTITYRASLNRTYGR